MDTLWKTTLWQQLGAAIDMLENAMAACPDELWSDRSQRPELWYVVYHTLFFLDLYLSGSVEGFAPPGARRICKFDWIELSGAEILLYNLRHVQHHAAQLNLILRQTIDSAPRWVARAR